MNPAGRLLLLYVPEPVRRRAIAELFDATAVAFGVPPPGRSRASAAQLLDSYARCTAEWADRALTSGCDLSVIRARLYRAANLIGARLRTRTGVSSRRDALRIARAVYGMLRIDFRPSMDGTVRIPRCFFSRYYRGAVCELISALDAGLLAGLTGGDRLEFRQRITEGAPMCVACLAEVQS